MATENKSKKTVQSFDVKQKVVLLAFEEAHPSKHLPAKVDNRSTRT